LFYMTFATHFQIVYTFLIINFIKSIIYIEYINKCQTMKNH